MANNIIAFNAGYGIVTEGAPDLVTSSNDVFGNGRGNYYGMPDLTGVNGNISADPLLSSIYRDVRIQPASPCRDAGNGEYVATATDRDGQPRVQGAHVDIGADESDGTTHTVPSRIWYVRPGGNDLADGTSWAMATATIMAALRLARGGDEVWVADGTYTESLELLAGEALYGGFTGIESSRSQRNASAHLTVVQPASATGTVVGAGFAGARVDGFTIRGGATGMTITGQATLANCMVLENRTGVVVYGGTATLINNYIGGSEYGVRVDTAVLEMYDTNVDYNTLDGIWASHGARLTLRRSGVQRNNSRGLFMEKEASADVKSSKFTENTLAAVWLEPGTRIDMSNSTLALTGWGGGGVSMNDATAHLANNIVAFHNDYGIRVSGALSDLTMAGNDLFANNPNYLLVPEGTQANNISVDPLFVDRANYDYRLQVGSPLIDAGQDSWVASGDRDMDSKPRIIGAHVDIGAYEYVFPGFVTMEDVLMSLRITGGTLASSPEEVTRLDVALPVDARISLTDVARLARKVAGLESNP